MSVSPEFLDRCAAETRFTHATLEKVIRLGELAGDIGRHPLLGRVLALKGGTALNLGLGEPWRLSVDLDFNYIGALERARMLDERPEVEAAVEGLARRKGYRVQRSADEHAGRKLYLEYRSVLGPLDRIQIDLNFLFRQPLGDPERRELWQPGELDRPRLLFTAIEEIVAGKLLALLDRSAARDAYDAAGLPRMAGAVLGSVEFRNLLMALSATLDHPLTRYGRERLDRVTDAVIREQLAGMLTTDETIEAATLKDRAWEVVEPFLTLSDDEERFQRRVHDDGELELEALFPEGGELSRRLATHPALQWKLLNVRRHRGHRRG